MSAVAADMITMFTTESSGPNVPPVINGGPWNVLVNGARSRHSSWPESGIPLMKIVKFHAAWFAPTTHRFLESANRPPR
jgi:hypothetical protein